MKMKYLKRFNESNEIDDIVSDIEDILLPIKDMDYNVGITNSYYSRKIFIHINNGETKYFLIDENIRETLTQLSDYISDLGLNMNINLFSRGKGLEKSYERSFTDVYRIPKYTYVSTIFINIENLHKLETEEKVLESSSNNYINQNIKDVENILLDFTDSDIPVEVYSKCRDKKIGYSIARENNIYAAIGLENYTATADTIYNFELNNELIQTIEQMNDYFESEGFEFENVYLLKVFMQGKESVFSLPESETFDNIEEFLKFAKDNIGVKKQKVKKLGTWREIEVKLKYTLIEFNYILK